MGEYGHVMESFEYAIRTMNGVGLSVSYQEGSTMIEVTLNGQVAYLSYQGLVDMMVILGKAAAAVA